MIYILRLLLYGSTRKLELTPTLENLTEAITTVRLQNHEVQAELMVTDGTNVLCVLKKDNIFDPIRSHLIPFPVEYKGRDSFQSKAGLNPPRDLARWILEG